jgi:FAD/FMN-containing dehydrogenase
MSAAKRVVVGGGDSDVGVVGWMTGGGHSPISAKYGLGADNVLEIRLVAPTGDILTANANTNTDLFWALRGVSVLLSVLYFYKT